MTVMLEDSEPETGPADGPTTGPGTRHARALAALDAVELRTGSRAVAHRTPGRAEPHQPDRPPLPVHPSLAGLLPDGGLRTGTTVVVRGSTSLLFALLADASRGGAWAALVGYPAAGLVAAADAGLDLTRTVTVPAPGPDAPAVLAALLDGMDVVVVGPEAVLLDVDRRRLGARARERGAVLVSAERSASAGAGRAGWERIGGERAGGESAARTWPGAHVVLEAESGTWDGVDHGAGWLRRRTLRVSRTGRGSAARPLRAEVDVPVCRAVFDGGSDGRSAGDGARTGAGPRLELVG